MSKERPDGNPFDCRSKPVVSCSSNVCEETAKSYWSNFNDRGPFSLQFCLNFPPWKGGVIHFRQTEPQAEECNEVYNEPWAKGHVLLSFWISSTENVYQSSWRIFLSFIYNIVHCLTCYKIFLLDLCTNYVNSLILILLLDLLLSL